jgi:rubrerythrin
VNNPEMDKIFAIAIDREIEAYEFYSVAAEKIKDPAEIGRASCRERVSNEV